MRSSGNIIIIVRFEIILEQKLVHTTMERSLRFDVFRKFCLPCCAYKIAVFFHKISFTRIDRM